MVRVWAVDPGAVATGLAWIESGGNAVLSDAMQFKDPIQVFEYINLWARPGDVVLIEDYSHGGTFTREAKQTLEVIGYLKFSLQQLHLYRVVLRHKDQRLSGQSEAAALLFDTVATLKKDPHRKDAFSALAHCVTYQRDMNLGL